MREMAASLSAAARGVSDTLHSHRAACSLRGALRGGSATSGSAFIVRRAGRNRPERRPALPPFRPWPGSTGTPPLVRIRTDTFLRREKCPRCRVRGCVSPGERKRNGNAACGGAGPGEAVRSKQALLLSGRRCGAGKPCAGWPRPCPPPHAAFRTRCTRTVQRVRSEAHYAAAAPRPARLSSCGRRGETGQSAALPRRLEFAPKSATMEP